MDTEDWLFQDLAAAIQDKFYQCCRSKVEITVLYGLNDKQHGGGGLLRQTGSVVKNSISTKSNLLLDSLNV